MTYAICSVSMNGIYEVSCCSCKRSIGTMTGEMLRQAMIFASRIGGVKCPECRLISCSRCGMEISDLSPQGQCFFCVWEIGHVYSQVEESEVEAVEMRDCGTCLWCDGECTLTDQRRPWVGVACLVKQKSRDV